MDVFKSKYMSIMLFWPLYEWNVHVSTPFPTIKISKTHITRSDKASLSPRTFKHSGLLHKTVYLVLNFKSNLGTHEHDLLAYERGAKGANLHPGVNVLPGANLQLVANCAHEHGFRRRSAARLSPLFLHMQKAGFS